MYPRREVNDSLRSCPKGLNTTLGHRRTLKPPFWLRKSVPSGQNLSRSLSRKLVPRNPSVSGFQIHTLSCSSLPSCIALHVFCPGNEDAVSTACPPSHHLAAAVPLRPTSTTKTTMPTLAPIPARQNGRQNERPRTPNRPGTSSSSKENEVSSKNSAPLADYVCVGFRREWSVVLTWKFGVSDPRRLLREGRFWFSLSGTQLGHWRDRGC